MKKLIYKSIGCGLLALSLSACSDYLDKEQYSKITPEQVWNEPKLIDAVLVSLYDGLYLEDFDYWHSNEWRLCNLTTMSDDGQGSFQKNDFFDDYNLVGVYPDDIFRIGVSDIYGRIRKCNDFIAQLKTATSLSTEKQAALDAETRFLRAWHYFAIVKRYGGMPLLKEAQQYTGEVESLQVPRNTEKELYDFIISECKAIAPSLPLTRSDAEKYRITQGGAWALCSRAALYAGSIAKYGTLASNNLTGVPASDANAYFKTAYDASKEVIDSKVYTLKDDGDKVDNFTQIFTKTTNGNNGEYIFQKQFSLAGGKAHSWEKRNAPFAHRGGGWGCGVAPTLELVEAFEYIDGSEGTLAIEDANGNPIRYDEPIDIFANKDPRLFASVYLPGSPIKDTKIDWLRGIIAPDGKKYQASAQPDNTASNTVEIGGKTYLTSGVDGGADAGDASKTGFYQKKFFDETLTDVNMGKSETPWVVFRLAEMYLNLAEAAVEMGSNESEALTAINAIRSRAGIATLTSLDLEKVRHERRVELAFENHRYWDLKRWRVAHLDVSEGGLNGFRGSALYPWLDLKDNKYVFEKGTHTPKRQRQFTEKNYYNKISSTDLNANPLLEQNPGYTN